MTTDSASAPSTDLSKRAFLTALSGFLWQGAQFFVGFAITPFLARTLGQSEFGLWTLLQQFNNYLSLGQFRVTGMLKLLIASGQGRLSVEEKRRFIAASFYLLCLFVGLCVLATIVASRFIDRIFNVPAHATTPAQWALILLSLGFAASQFATIPGAVLKGENREYAMMGVRAIVLVGASLASALFVYLGWGLVGMGAGYALGHVIQCLLNLIAVRRVFPWFGLGQTGWPDVRQQASGSGWLLLSSVALLLSSSFDLMLVGILFDPATAAQYYVAGALCRFLQFPVSIAINSVAPGLAGLLGNGEIGRLNRANHEFAVLVLFVSGVAGAVVIALNPAFVQVWMGKSYSASNLLAIAVVLSSLSAVFINSAINLFDAAVEFPHRTFYLLTGAAMGICLSIVLGAHFGLWGFALGQFLGRLVVWATLNRFLLKQHRIQHPFPVRLACVAGAIWALASLHPVPSHSWLSLALYGVLVSSAASVALFFAGLAENDRTALLERFRAIVAKIRRRRRDSNLPSQA